MAQDRRDSCEARGYLLLLPFVSLAELLSILLALAALAPSPGNRWEGWFMFFFFFFGVLRGSQGKFSPFFLSWAQIP